MCTQKTKWISKKAKHISEWGYKLLYTGRDKNKNKLGIILDYQLVEIINARKRAIRLYSLNSFWVMKCLILLVLTVYMFE